MNKVAKLFVAEDLIDLLEEMGKSLGYEVDVETDYAIEENTTIISYFLADSKPILSVVVLYARVYNQITIFDKDNTKILQESIKADHFDKNEYQNVINKVQEELSKDIKQGLNTAEEVYEYGTKNNWKGITKKQYETLMQHRTFVAMAIEDMEEKGIVVPDILKNFRRKSMRFKDVVVSKIANHNEKKQKISRIAKMHKKAEGEEDLDIKLKVQKNKPAGLDTSSPKSLPESIRPLMTDLKDKITTLKETEAELANTKAGLDAQYQKAKDESKIVEKQAEIENLTTNIGKLLFAAKNETFQFQDNLVALTHQVKSVPAKATDKWKFEKVFAKLKELMGDDNAQKFLDNTLNGLQSQATEKVITELNIFSPTQKQMKTSDTSDTNKFIDALKEIYVNLRNYYIDVKKANNILETELATGATASKKQVVTKKAETNLVEGKWYRLRGLPFDIKFTGEITEDGNAVFTDRKFREVSFDKNFDFIETNRVPMDEEGFKTLWDWAFTNRAVLRYTLDNMFPEDLTAFSNWMSENKTEEEIKAFNEKMPLDYLMKGSSKKAEMHKKAGESYGWLVKEEDAQDKLDLWIQAVGTEKALDDLRYAMGNFELANNLAYIFRVNDFREGCSDYEEDTDVESKKKVNLKKAKTNKKAKINKKATVSLEMEIDDYIELLKNEYETSPEDWKTRGSRMLMNEFYEYMENFDGGKVQQPSVVMDNFLINGSFCERATDFTADGEWSNKFEEYKGNWEEFCENEAVLYNEDAACTNLGF